MGKLLEFKTNDPFKSDVNTLTVTLPRGSQILAVRLNRWGTPASVFVNACDTSEEEIRVLAVIWKGQDIPNGWKFLVQGSDVGHLFGLFERPLPSVTSEWDVRRSLVETISDLRKQNETPSLRELAAIAAMQTLLEVEADEVLSNVSNTSHKVRIANAAVAMADALVEALEPKTANDSPI